MNFKPVIFFIVLVITSLQPVATLAMGERPQAQKTSRMCDMSGETQKFILTSGNGEVKETFKVPVRYMHVELERNGKVNGVLHIAALLDNLSPRCKDDGEFAPKEEALEVALHPVLRPKDEWVELSKMIYADTDTVQFEEIEIAGHPEFTFEASKKRPKAVENSSARYAYIPVYSKQPINIPVYYRLDCALRKDMRTLNMCNVDFLYSERIAVRATFHATNLEKIEQIYYASLELVKKFHVK